MFFCSHLTYLQRKLLLNFLVHFLPFSCFTSNLINEISGIVRAIQIQTGHPRRPSTLPALMPLLLAIQHFLRQFGIGVFALLPTASMAQEAGSRGHQRTSKSYRTQGQDHEARLASHSMHGMACSGRRSTHSRDARTASITLTC